MEIDNMTLREKIADWLTGGALSKAVAALEESVMNTRGAIECSNAYERLMKKYSDELEAEEIRHAATMKGYVTRGNALHAIIARGNTSSPNSTVKAMQKIAREALGE